MCGAVGAAARPTYLCLGDWRARGFWEPGSPQLSSRRLSSVGFTGEPEERAAGARVSVFFTDTVT